MDGINSDKVNINLGEGGGGGAGSMAAVIAALGNRNQGDNTAALIAALGNRNDGHRGDDGGFGFGGGGGILGLVALLGLLGKRGFGGGDDCGDGNGGKFAILQTLMENGADLRAAIPATALETTNACQRAISELALGTQQGLSNVKDAVQAIGALNLSATQGVAKDVATYGLQQVIVTKDDGEKTRLLLTNFNNEELNRKLTVAQLDGIEGRLRHHSDGVESRVNQTVSVNTNQQQAQWQSQRFEDERFSRLAALVANIGNQVQRSRTENDVVNFGTMAASGNQSSQNTQVK